MPTRDEVVADNAGELAKMDSEAAGLVQQFFLECEKRDTLVALSAAEEGGKSVGVDVVSGNEGVPSLVARLLRMELVDGRLEV